MVANQVLSVWQNFYIIVGSSAGALTGLQFVVMALVAQSPARAGLREIDAFGTPTIVHFCAVLLVSAVLSAPWPELWEAASITGLCGVLGFAYTLIVVRRARRTTKYKPALEDWIWHAALPLIAYLTLFVAATTITIRHVEAFFGIAAFALALLFVGIHNAWDTATYVAVVMLQTTETTEKPRASPPTLNERS